MYTSKLIIAILLSTSLSAMANNEFNLCLEKLEKEAPSKGVLSSVFFENTKNLTPNMKLIENLNFQPEFKTPIWDYISLLVEEDRISEGKLMLQKHEEILNNVHEKYGVNPYTVVAVWAVESNFGQNFGKYNLVESLGTLSCFGRRTTFFQGEFFSALRIIQEGHIKKEDLKGSWAGAFGHTQFMPTTFEKLAVDFDNDGRKDLITSIPDALASTANFLKNAGWKDSIPWGYEVKIPMNFDINGHSRKNKLSHEEWVSKGVTLADGSILPSNIGNSGLMMISGVKGPLFLVNKNFDAIYKYNAAESYALAISYLSQRLEKDTRFITPWPTYDGPLNREQRVILQKILVSKGHEIGEIKGDIGPKTRSAIKFEQQKLGIEQNGRAGEKIFKLLNEN
jgi:lytic murein transglycosylase